MKVVAIVQARLTSTRLPNKVLKDISGKPMLSPYLSAIDLLFNTSGEATKYIKEGLKDALKLDQEVSK
jgi:hypothetical protein